MTMDRMTIEITLQKSSELSFLLNKAMLGAFNVP